LISIIDIHHKKGDFLVMKKIVSLILAAVLCFASFVTLTSCDNIRENLGDYIGGKTDGEAETFTGLDEEEWQESLSEQKFDNVTINYKLEIIEGQSADQTHVVKIAENAVYRKMTMVMGGQDMSDEQYFTDVLAEQQKNIFLQVFLSLLADRENFEYNAEEDAYFSPSTVTVTLDMGDGMSATEVMKDGKVTFDKNGNIEYFYCELTETTIMEGQEVASITCKATWTFSDYGTTVIEVPAEESTTD
jgi:hypothetical protein